MKKFLTTLIIILILITGTSSVFALTESDERFLLEFIKTYSGDIVSEYGTEIFENVEEYDYILMGSYPWTQKDNPSIILTNFKPLTNSSSTQNLNQLLYGNSSEITYGYITTIATPTIGERTTTSDLYNIPHSSLSAIFDLSYDTYPLGIINTDIMKNEEIYWQGGRQNTNFLNFIHNYNNNTLEIAFGRKQINPTYFQDIKPTSITINYYDTSGTLVTNEIIKIDYESSNYDADKNTYTYDLIGTHFYGGANVPLKRIINISTGTNWYQKWTSEPIDWNENPGSGENPPSGGSSSITGTGTGTSTGTVDENGNVNIDNNIDINLDTTPITDGLNNIKDSLDNQNNFLNNQPNYDENGELAEEQDGLIGAILKGIQNIFKWLFGWLFEVNEPYVNTLINEFSDTLANNDSMIVVPMYLLTETINLFTNYTPKDFVISWDNIEYQEITVIEEGSINFNELINENEIFGRIYEIWITVESFGIIILFANWLRNLFFELLGIDWNGLKADENEMTITNVIDMDTGESYQTFSGEDIDGNRYKLKRNTTKIKPKRKIGFRG